MLVPTIATSSAVISLPCLATAMICHCRSEKSRLFLDVKLEAKAQHCHQTSCQTFTLGETSTNMGKHRFHQAHNLKYISLFITILAVFGPLDPLELEDSQDNFKLSPVTVLTTTCLQTVRCGFQLPCSFFTAVAM